MAANVYLEGRLTADAEFRAVGDEGGFVRFRIATNRRYLDKNKERKADFFNVSRWIKNGSKLPEMLTKGKQVVITGTLENDNFQGKEGSMVYRDVINASDIVMVGPRPTDDHDNVTSDSSSRSGEEAPDTDLPF